MEFVRLTLQLQSGKDLHREILAACWQRHALCEKQIEIELFELRHFFCISFLLWVTWVNYSWPMSGGVRSGSGRRWQNSNRRVGAWLLCDSPGWCLDASGRALALVETGRNTECSQPFLTSRNVAVGGQCEVYARLNKLVAILRC